MDLFSFWTSMVKGVKMSIMKTRLFKYIEKFTSKN